MSTLHAVKGFYNQSNRLLSLDFTFEIQVDFDESGQITWHMFVHIDPIEETYYRKLKSVSGKTALVFTLRSLQTHLYERFGSIQALKNAQDALLGDFWTVTDFLGDSTVSKIIVDCKLSKAQEKAFKKKLTEKK